MGQILHVNLTNSKVGVSKGITSACWIFLSITSLYTSKKQEIWKTSATFPSPTNTFMYDLILTWKLKGIISYKVIVEVKNWESTVPILKSTNYPVTALRSLLLNPSGHSQSVEAIPRDNFKSRIGVLIHPLQFSYNFSVNGRKIQENVTSTLEGERIPSVYECQWPSMSCCIKMAKMLPRDMLMTLTTSLLSCTQNRKELEQ